jgi:aminoglycoside 2''-phosphotransferase
VERMTSEIQRHLETIKRVLPFDITEVSIHDSGDDFLVIEINAGWMFRFPRQAIAAKAMEVEKVFLCKFKETSPLPVPDYRYAGEYFAGYPKIHGEVLSPEIFQGLSPTTRDQIARQIGEFLSAVHNFPVDEAKRIGLTEGWGGWYAKIIQNFREVVAPALSPSARQNGLACIEQMAAEKFESKVIHGDFALEDHVFFDGKRQELSGVIDFADVTLNDPAHDFQNIVEYGGEAFFEAVMSHYRGENDPALLKRTRLRIQTRPLLEASYSLLFGFEERFKERMGYIEAKYG